MLIFLDTEFTRFHQPELISIGLVGEDGREFYSARTDYRRDTCSEFVREIVEPLLGRVPGAACGRQELSKRLHVWFEQLSEPATVIFDFDGDWRLLMDAIGKPPANFGDRLHLANSSISHPEFERAQNLLYTLDWPPHHALADARALMADYRAWHSLERACS